MTDITTPERPFGFWTASALVVGGVIGAGIYVLPAQLAPFGWNGIAAWVAGGLAALAIARVLAGVVAARPREPGLIAVIGAVLGPVYGCVVGWGVWVSDWCGNAYISLTGARYAGAVWPPLGATPLRQALTASAIIAALAALNLVSLKGAGRFQVATTMLKLLPLAAVLLILAGLVARGGGGFAALPPPRLDAGVFPATALAFAAIMGFEAASVAAQRVRDPERTVPRATLLGVALASTVYLLICAGLYLTLPDDALARSSAPLALFVGAHWGAGAGIVVAAFAVVSCVGGLNTWIMRQSEVPLALVRAGLLPEWLGRTNASDVAAAPLLLASALTIALLLAGSWGNGAAVMEFMLLLTSVAGVWVYVFASLAAFALNTHRVLAGVSLAFSAALFYGAGWVPVLLSTALLLAALPLYSLATRGGAVAAEAA